MSTEKILDIKINNRLNIKYYETNQDDRDRFYYDN